MATRIYYYQEDLTRTTTTTTDYSVAKVTKAFTPTSGNTYAIFWSGIVDVPSAGNAAGIRLRNTTTSTTISEHTYSCRVTSPTTAKIALGGLALFTAGSGSEQTLSIQFISGNVSYSVACQEASILILELTTADKWNSSIGNTASTSTTYADKVALSWTPGSAGDYTIIGAADVLVPGFQPKAQMLVNGSAINIASRVQNESSWERVAYRGMARLVGVSAAQTASIQFGSTAGASNSIENAHIVALRNDGFDAAFSAEDRSAHTSTSATYADSASVTGTPGAVDHLILASGICGIAGSDANTSTGQKINAAGSDVGTNFAQLPGGNTGNDVWTWFESRVITPAASSQTWKTQYARTVGTDTAQSDEHVIAVLQLVASGPPPSTQRWSPDSIAASTNLTGAVANIQDDPDSPDGSWLTATSATAATDVRVTFPTPSGDPISTQNFRTWLRKTAGATTPTVDISLYQGGSSIALLTDNASITSTTGEILQADWNANQLVTVLDGSDVECRIVSTPGASAGTITRTATPTSFSTSTADVTNWGFSHTAAADTSIILLTVLCEAHYAVSGTPTWDAGGTPQDFSLIRATTSSNTDGDMRAYVYGVIPNVTGARTIGLTMTGSGIDNGFACAVSYIGTVTSSVAAAAIYIDEQINNSAAATVAMNEAVGGTSGRTAFAVADFLGGDGDPAGETAATGFSELFNSATGASTLSDISYWVGDKINWTPSAVTVDWTSSSSDECCGILIELVPGPGSAVNTVEIGAIEWNVSYTAGEPVTGNPMMKRLGGIPFMTQNLRVW